MQIRADETFGKCGCGRSPTGNCIGWHALSEEAYKKAKDEYDLNEWRKTAGDLWFVGGSCTGGVESDGGEID
jgi:hypothetical protein